MAAHANTLPSLLVLLILLCYGACGVHTLGGRGDGEVDSWDSDADHYRTLGLRRNSQA